MVSQPGWEIFPGDHLELEESSHTMAVFLCQRAGLSPPRFSKLPISQTAHAGLTLILVMLKSSPNSTQTHIARSLARRGRRQRQWMAAVLARQRLKVHP